MSGVAWFFLILFILLIISAVLAQTFFQMFEWSWWPHPFGVFFMPEWFPFGARHREILENRGYRHPIVESRHLPSRAMKFGHER